MGDGLADRLLVHLAPRDVGELHEHARAVQAGERGLGRGSEALAALSRPREGAAARVEAWTVGLGGRVAGASPLGDFLDVELPEAAAAAALGPVQALGAVRGLPEELAGDVLRAHWLGLPEGVRPSGAEASPQAPRVAPARSLLKETTLSSEELALLQGGDVPTTAAWGDTIGVSSGVAALLTRGLYGEVHDAYVRTFSQASLLNDAMPMHHAAMVIPCGVGVDPLTRGMTIEYHSSSGRMCSFSTRTTLKEWYGDTQPDDLIDAPEMPASIIVGGGQWATYDLKPSKQYRCGDLFPAETAEQSCRDWGRGMTLGMASTISDIAILPQITVDTTVFVYNLEELPTFVGLSDADTRTVVTDFDFGAAKVSGKGGLAELVRLETGLKHLGYFNCEKEDDSAAACFNVDMVHRDASFFVESSESYPFSAPSHASMYSNTPLILGATVTPDYAKRAYGAGGNAPGTASGLGMLGLYLGSYNAMNQTALDEATAAFGLPSPEVIVYPGPLGPDNYISRQDGSVKRINPQADCLGCFFGVTRSESNLNVQMVAEYGPGADVGFIPTIDGLLPEAGAPFTDCAEIDYYIYVLQANQETSPPKRLPKVISLSWGLAEESSRIFPDGLPMMGHCEESFAKLAAMGVHAVVSSGNDGAVDHTSYPGKCNEQGEVGYSYLMTSYPATSPYVTAVGATMDIRMAPGEEPVVAACMGPLGGGITSGGGFSWVYERPDWQSSAVEGYLAKDHSAFPYLPAIDKPDKDLNRFDNFNPDGRGVPDVSLYGYNIPILDEDTVSIIAGTSATAPAFAGLLLQLHARLEESGACGDRDIVFVQLNRFLYAASKTHADAFIDIVHGHNAFGMGLEFCGLGYPASEGWDPVTGLGMPYMPALTVAAIEMAEEYFCAA